MAIPAQPLNEILVMNAKQREEYFMKFAQFMPDAPQKPYVIRFGSTTLFSEDTMELRQAFEAEIKRLRRKAGVKVAK